MNIPSNLSENTYRLYEPHLLRALKRWPDETEFPVSVQVSAEGKQLSPNTFAARMRDSVVSVLRFNWEGRDENGQPTTFVLEKLRSIAGTFAVAFDPAGSGSVWFRARGIKGRPSALVQEQRSAGRLGQAVPDRSEWKNVTVGEVRSVCILIHHGRMEGPIIIDGTIEPDFTATLESEYNVAITFDSHNNKTVIT